MIRRNSNFDISSESSLVRTANGFMLSQERSGAIRLNQINQLSFNFYLTNTNHVMQCVNELDADTMGCSSPASAKGKSIFDVTDFECANNIANNNKKVMCTNSMLIIEEDNVREEYYQRCLSIKWPLYQNNKTIGIFGCSVYFERDSLAESLAKITELGILTPTTSKETQNKIMALPFHLSKREKECLYYTIKGKSAREISLILQLSRRTVEQYLENIKNKMRVNTRSEIIEIGFNFIDLLH